METKYEIKYYGLKDGKNYIMYTNSFIKFAIIGLTKRVIYYKVNYRDKYDDFLI